MKLKNNNMKNLFLGAALVLALVHDASLVGSAALVRGGSMVVKTAGGTATRALGAQAGKFAGTSSSSAADQAATPAQAKSSTAIERAEPSESFTGPAFVPDQPTEQDEMRRLAAMTPEAVLREKADKEAEKVIAQQKTGAAARAGALFQPKETKQEIADRLYKQYLREQVMEKLKTTVAEREALEKQSKAEEQAQKLKAQQEEAAEMEKLEELLRRGPAEKPAAEQPEIVKTEVQRPVVPVKDPEKPKTSKKKQVKTKKAQAAEAKRLADEAEAKRLAEAQAAEQRLKAAQDAEAEQVARQAALARLEEAKRKELEAQREKELKADQEAAESIRQMQQRETAAEQAKIAREAEIKRLADEAEAKRVAEEQARVHAEQLAAEERQAQEEARRQAEQKEQQRQEQERLRLEFEKEEREKKEKQQEKEEAFDSAQTEASKIMKIVGKEKLSDLAGDVQQYREEQERIAQQKAAAEQAEKERLAAELEAQRAREEQERIDTEKKKKEIATLEQEGARLLAERARHKREVERAVKELQNDLSKKTNQSILEEPLSFGERGGISFSDLPEPKTYRMILPGDTSAKTTTVLVPHKGAEKLPEPAQEAKKLRPSKDEQAKVVETPTAVSKPTSRLPVPDTKSRLKPLESIIEESEEPVKEEVLFKEEPSVEPKAEPVRETERKREADAFEAERVERERLAHEPLGGEPLEAKGVEAAGIRAELSKEERAATPEEQKKELAANVMSVIQKNYASGAAVVKGKAKEAVFEQIPAQDISALDDSDLREFEAFREEYNKLGSVGNITERLKQMKYVGGQMQALLRKLVGQRYIVQILKKQVG
ncbi:hypothetical protein JST99_02345 [Candidatus Dependentiae bacterium]|nr:hypothetical protein [Candidatus Dependentiae bacterium]